MYKMPRITLYEEYRLIEKNETAINKAWKGAHLLLFFLAFVFGSFCTFCFHMLMYLFDEKCVLFPKLLSLTSMRHNVIYEFIPSKEDLSDLPVDFLSTQWVEKSTCSLPTYVPLVSGIFGLVWTTLFLMCSTGSRTLTGLQRPWRVLPPVFVFSLAMCGLCIYSSAVTHYGLQELCNKLGEITGSSTCTYTVNVVTLAYERRIRGVYQATRLTIASAWLHTACWFCSALLAVVRILLVVDFQVVKISVSLKADIDKIMERNETQLKSISPSNLWINTEYQPGSNESTSSITESKQTNDTVELLRNRSETSVISSKPTEENRLMGQITHKNVLENKRFIVNIVFELVDNLNLPDDRLTSATMTKIIEKDSDKFMEYGTQYQKLDSVTAKEDKFIALYTNRLNKTVMPDPNEDTVTNTRIDPTSVKISPINNLFTFKRDRTRKCMKTNLKNAVAQTEIKQFGTESSDDEDNQYKSDLIQEDKETQTRKKEKQD